MNTNSLSKLFTAVILLIWFAAIIGLMWVGLSRLFRSPDESTESSQQVKPYDPNVHPIDTTLYRRVQERQQREAEERARMEREYVQTSGRTTSDCSYDDEAEEGTYLDELRKHSPNDDYLLGFDEDVDDVHDVELYIEDY